MRSKTYTDEELNELRSIFSYNPLSGAITIKKTRKGSGLSVGDECGCADPNGYIRVPALGSYILAHRLAFILLGQEPPDMVDHINQDKQNNTWRNLRATTNSLNMRNTKARNSLGVKGIYKNNKGWKVQRTVDSKTIVYARTPCLGQALKIQKEIYVPL